VDGGLHDEAQKTSAGWCVRDSRNQYVLGGRSWIHGSCSSNEGETLALLEAMNELRLRGFNDIIFEIDAQNIMYVIHQRNIGVLEFRLNACSL
jgi:ribonuclease HI